jgi:hypothetical protein
MILKTHGVAEAHQMVCWLASIAFCLLLAPQARSQEPTPAPPTIITPQDLAKSVHNPFEDFIKIPIQAETGFNVGRHHSAGEAVNVQPTIPFSLNADWDLIARPSMTVTYTPTPSSQFGLNDLQTAFYLTRARASEWIWGVGPIFEFPIASSTDLGTGRWSAGPTAAFIYSQGPWFNGVLAYHLMSFAGDRRRGSVNQTYIEPDISYNFDSGWYVQVDPPISYDWTAEEKDAWVLPVGADVGKAFNLGPQAMSVQLGSYDLVKHPEGGPGWMVRASVTLLLPSGL